ncbi:MAG: hypothetical protein RL215_484 [Planctomycetota bacterium]|jgi:hypothetical protein
MNRVLAGVLIYSTTALFSLPSAAAQEASAPLSAPAVETAPTPQAVSMDEFLPPLRELTLSYSTPRRELRVPEGDFVTNVTAEPVPAWYLTPPWFAVRRPVRTLYPFKHRPLYFEDPAAERCGVSCGCLQPAVSFARFTADTLLLPCRMCQQNPNDCIPAGRDCPVACPPPGSAKTRRSTAGQAAVQKKTNPGKSASTANTQAR